MTTARKMPTFRLPDRPEREPDDMTSFDHLTSTSIIEPLRYYLGNLDSTLVYGDKYLCQVITRYLRGSRYPDLLVAFNADIEGFRQRNGYIIEEQGKPPDFVLEIASRRTGTEDVTGKRTDYAAMGIPEYWRFDETETGRDHGTRLAGDRLIDGQYQPLPIRQVSEDILEGYSPVLNIILRWERGQLKWHDPETGLPIPTFLEEREARLRAEAHARELEEEIKRLRNR